LNITEQEREVALSILRGRQAMSLTDKIGFSQDKIRYFYEEYNGKVIVLNSTHEDTKVLIHIAQLNYPDINISVVGTLVDRDELVGYSSIISDKACDSPELESYYLENGCNFYGENPISRPLSIWNDDDIHEYIKMNRLGE